MRGRRMCTARGVLDHAFFFGVAVEADDRAQPARHRRRAVPRSFGSREAFDVDATNLEQAVLMPPAPRGELAQVQRVGVAGIAAVAGEEPERVVCSTLLITGRYRSTAVVVVDMVRDLPVIVAGSPDTSMPIGRASRRVPPTFGRDIRARRLRPQSWPSASVPGGAVLSQAGHAARVRARDESESCCLRSSVSRASRFAKSTLRHR
jgi:hypothetical protein